MPSCAPGHANLAHCVAPNKEEGLQCAYPNALQGILPPGQVRFLGREALLLCLRRQHVSYQKEAVPACIRAVQPTQILGQVSGDYSLEDPRVAATFPETVKAGQMGMEILGPRSSLVSLQA